ncbi:hypothetical protein ABEF93_007842 [Exophiala dermatitidis]
MPRWAEYDDASESRTATIGAKRSSSRHQGQVHSSPQSPVHSESVSPSDRAVMGNSPSHYTQEPLSPVAEQFDSTERHGSEHAMSPEAQGLGNNRLATGFRKPRVALSTEPVSGSDAHDSAYDNAGDGDRSRRDTIEISSDEDESSDNGGMVINLDDDDDEEDARIPDAMVVDDDEEGEVFSSEDEALESHSLVRDISHSITSAHQDAHQQLQAELEQITDSLPTTYPTPPPAENGEPGRRRLADLTPDELELQLKYALFDVSHDQVDLRRPAVCLSCLQEGHVEEKCPEKICVYCAEIGQHPSRLCPRVRRCSRCRERGHSSDACPSDMKITTVPCDLCGAYGHHEHTCPQRFFPFESGAKTSSLNLWVSCCVCASNSHLVGDCPDADRAATVKWSLKSFAPAQITNLTTGDEAIQRARIAATRGLRPEGLQIRGRAGRHTAGFSASAQPSGSEYEEDDSSDGEFLGGPRVNTRSQPNRGRGGFTFRHPQRLPGNASDRPRDGQDDRYNPAANRPRNNWYATDSFGRARPRSQPVANNRNGDPWSRRDGDSRRRSRSPRGFDGYQPRQRRSPSPRYHNGSHPSSAGSSRAPTGRRGGGSSQLKPGVPIQLPVRRGSSNFSNNDSLPPRPPQASGPGPGPGPNQAGKNGKAGPKKKKSKKGKGKANA